jgi:hypothetical protein
MPLIQLVQVLIVVGVLLWLVNRFIPMAGSVKSISECGGGHRSGGVGPEGRWALGFPFQDPRRLIGRL